jgi:hypothetical protein
MEDSLDEGSKPAEFYASVFGKDSIQLIERTYPTPQTGRDAHPAESLGGGAGKKDSTEVKPNAQWESFDHEQMMTLLSDVDKRAQELEDAAHDEKAVAGETARKGNAQTPDGSKINGDEKESETMSSAETGGGVSVPSDTGSTRGAGTLANSVRRASEKVRGAFRTGYEDKRTETPLSVFDGYTTVALRPVNRIVNYSARYRAP